MSIINNISKNEIKRLSEVAGVLRLDRGIYDLTRNIMTQKLGEILRRSLLITEYKKRRTLKRDDIASALRTMNIVFSAPIIFKSMSKKGPPVKKSTSNKTHRYRPGTRTKMNITRLQKSSNKFMIRPKPFRDLVRSIVDQFNPVRISKNSFYLLQFYMETSLIKLFMLAYRIPLNEKTKSKGVYVPRKSLFTKDVILAADLTGFYY